MHAELLWSGLWTSSFTMFLMRWSDYTKYEYLVTFVLYFQELGYTTCFRREWCLIHVAVGTCNFTYPFFFCVILYPLCVFYYERIFSYIAYPRPLRVKFRQVYFIWEICQVMLDRANYFLSIKDLTLIPFLGILLPTKFCFKIWLICVLFYFFFFLEFWRGLGQKIWYLSR